MKENVLIVEDSQMVSELLSKKFKDSGFKPIVCKSLKETKDFLTNNTKNILAAILDLSLPDAPNREIVDEVLKYDISSIVLSATYDSDVYNKMLEKDIIDYVIKNGEEDLDYVVKMVEKIRFYTTQTVLLVDDSKLFRDVISSYLKKLSFNNILEAENGEEALKIYNNNTNISLVITDYNMPKMDGYELVLNLRKKKSKDELVILAVTTNDSYEVSSKFLKYGANGYIAKPFTKEAFNYSINNAMELYQILAKNRALNKILDKNIAYSTTNSSGKITRFSKAFESITGYKVTELIGKKHSVLKSGETHNEIYKNMWQNISSGNKWNGILKNTKKSGEEFWLKIQIEPQKNMKNEITGYTSINYDVTDKVLKEEQQNIILHEARFATMGQTISTITHQWRQPLCSISVTNSLIMFELEELGIKNGILLDNLNRIEKITSELSDTINNFGKFFSQSREKTIFRIDTILRECIELSDKILYNNKIAVKYELNQNLEFYSYKNELKQILMILLINSKEAIINRLDTGSIEQGLIKINISEESLNYCITFSDNGRGISEDMLNRVFEPYFSTKINSEKKGLGLYFVKMMVEKTFQGKILVDNDKQGAIFNIFIKK